MREATRSAEPEPRVESGRSAQNGAGPVLSVAAHRLTHVHVQAVKVSRSALKNVKNEYQGYLVSIRSLNKIIDKLRREKAAHETDLQVLISDRCGGVLTTLFVLQRRQIQKLRAEEEAASRDAQIVELQRQVSHVHCVHTREKPLVCRLVQTRLV